METLCICIVVLGFFVFLFSLFENESFGVIFGLFSIIVGGAFLTNKNPSSIQSEKQRKQELLKELKELEKDKSLYKLKTENDKLEDSIYKIKNGL
jgi:hypothetical protein